MGFFYLIMQVTALIPARKGSKGIKKKNIKEFCGKPLIQWTLNSALESKYIDQVIVSTDCDQIASLAVKSGAEVPYIRPPNLSSDTANMIDVVLDLLNKFPKIEDLLLLQPTSPLRDINDINGIIEERQKYKSESAVSIVRSSNHPSLMFKLDKKNKLTSFLKKFKHVNRQSLEQTFSLNGAMYLATRTFLFREKSFIGDDTLGYLMPPERSLDIDNSFDWSLGEFLFKSTI